MSELDMSLEHVNEYLVEVELCFNQLDKLRNPILMFLKYIEHSFESIHKNLIQICEGESSFRVSAKGIVESETNSILKCFIDSLVENKSVFLDLSEGLFTLDLSIYIWSLKASDTPQIDIGNEILKLFGDIGINLSLVVYTYDPD